MGFLAFILVLIAFTGVVSFVMAALLRSNALCMIVSAVIAEALVVLYGLVQAGHSSDVYDVLLAVNITLIIGTPVFIIAAIGFTLLARRLYRKHPQS
jgi:hypothetical protein